MDKNLVQAKIANALTDHKIVVLMGRMGSPAPVLVRDVLEGMEKLTPQESAEVTAIYRKSGLMGAEYRCAKCGCKPRWTNWPIVSGYVCEACDNNAIIPEDNLTCPPVEWPRLRAPHHTVSANAMLGTVCGDKVRPGEMSLAHRGILFLDEGPEFRRDVLSLVLDTWKRGTSDCMRIGMNQPDAPRTPGVPTATFPARFGLVIDMNYCPCGRCGQDIERCSLTERARYTRRITERLKDAGVEPSVEYLHV